MEKVFGAKRKAIADQISSTNNDCYIFLSTLKDYRSRVSGSNISVCWRSVMVMSISFISALSIHTCLLWETADKRCQSSLTPFTRQALDLPRTQIKRLMLFFLIKKKTFACFFRMNSFDKVSDQMNSSYLPSSNGKIHGTVLNT